MPSESEFTTKTTDIEKSELNIIFKIFKMIIYFIF